MEKFDTFLSKVEERKKEKTLPPAVLHLPRVAEQQ